MKISGKNRNLINIGYIIILLTIFCSCKREIGVEIVNKSSDTCSVNICWGYIVNSECWKVTKDDLINCEPFDLTDSCSVKITNGSIDSCYEFKIPPNHRIELVKTNYDIFNEGENCNIGSIEVKSDFFYRKAILYQIKKMFEIKEDSKYGYNYVYYIR